MATQTIVLAATLSAAVSADIIVDAVPVVVALFASDGVISFGMQCAVQRKIGANYQPAMDARGPIYLSESRPEVTLAAAGTYNVNKYATLEAIGVTKDESATDTAPYSRGLPITLLQSASGAANTALTVTLPAAGAGLFHYITGIEIVRNATASLAGTAALAISTTNLPGALGWAVGNAMAAGGTQVDVSRDFTNPIKSSAANTASTLVLPAPGLAVAWRANIYYYTGP